MTGSDDAATRIDTLIRQFIHEASSFADLDETKSLTWTPGQLTLQQRQLAQKLASIAAELETAEPISEIRARLFDNDNPTVRLVASLLFAAIDPEWSMAAGLGVVHELGTEEVLALRDHVLKGPPARPTLEQMTVEQLVSRFVDAATRCYWTTRVLSEEENGGTKMTAYNERSHEINGIAKALKERDRLDALLPLLDHSLIAVRLRAAQYSLPVATERAKAVLEAIKAAQSWPEDSGAYVILLGWQMNGPKSLWGPEK